MCGLDARGRCHQARHVCAREKNGAAAVRALAVAAGGDVEVAPVGAAEAEARHERRGHRQHALEPAVGAEARDAAPRAERDPHPTRLVDGEAVGVAARHAREDAPVDAAPVVGEVVRQDDALAVARVVDGPAVGCEADAVGERDVAVDLDRPSRAVDPPELAGHPILALQRGGAQRADEDMPRRVGREVVEAEHTLDGEEDACLALAHVRHVSAGDHDAAVGVQHEPADATPLGHDDRHRAVGRAPVDAAVDRVAEVEVAGPVDPGRLHEAVAEGERLHRRGGTPGARAKQAWHFPELLAKMPAVTRREIQDLSRGQLEAWCLAAAEPRYRATQILAWVHRKGADGFGRMSNLARGLRDRLDADFSLGRLAPVFVADAADGTRKLLFHLPGEGDARPAAIESVLIPQLERAAGARDRLTLCISSQAGCGMGCGFCATARMGLVRNLSPAEIVGQVRAGRALAAPRPLTNIVFMGMGEPLANYEAVRTALDILTAEWGYAISPRRITVSTVGLAPAVSRLIAETGVNLAVSLSATTDPQRDRLMPVNRRFPLAALLRACRELPLPRRKRITFEYVLLAGENDADADARRLVHLLHGLRVKVNLIPFNPFPGAGFAASPRARILRFQAILRAHGIGATIRESRGQDIQAACGQLAAARPAA